MKKTVENRNAIIVASVMILMVLVIVIGFSTALASSKKGDSPKTTTAAPMTEYKPQISYQKETEEFGYDVLDNGTIAIKKYLANGEAVVIPEEIDGKKVTVICENIFYYSPQVKKLSIPESITDIESCVFTGPTSFEELRYEGSRISFEKIDISSTGNMYSGYGYEYYFDIVFGKRENE